MLQVLKAIYSEQYKNPLGFVESDRIKEQVHITDSELEEIVKYLEGKGLFSLSFTKDKVKKEFGSQIS